MEKQLTLMLADDDNDDRFFFKKVPVELPIPIRLITVDSGDKLLHYLQQNYRHLPDILFLDLNMPRKNGSECLETIKADKKLKHIPVIIYSTSLHDEVADHLYQKGAHYYIRKTDILELKKILHHILKLLLENKFARPPREKFLLNMVNV